MDYERIIMKVLDDHETEIKELRARIEELEQKLQSVSLNEEAPNTDYRVSKKYEALADYFKLKKGTFTLSFSEIEKINGCELPPSARNYREFWANTKYNVHARSWLVNNYRVKTVDIENETVTFEEDNRR